MNETSLAVFRTVSYFIIYAFFGWCLEVVYQAVEHGKFINRGFLNGPYCTIYGFGVIIVCYALEPIKDNLIVLYVGAVLLTTSLELLTGFLLEKIFNQKWWDYSKERFNLKGYICLKFSLLWGVACLVAVRLIHPSVERFVSKIPQRFGVVILSLIMVGFISDMIITVMAIIHIKKKLKLLEDISAEMRKISDKTGQKLFDGVELVMDKKNELDEKTEVHRKRFNDLAEKYKQLLEKRTLTSKRLANAFPKLKLYPVKGFREQLEELRKDIKKRF
ncbi:MAG: putative ABC transporter permease [Ruminococcus sp.]|uniref:putative ABC transporter permease n=1 Tax=Ruminococcus sp. TaxID=41978 RepID=UPI0025DB545E|nr:putative ABC transporter permease [Ruminococcus sp.]MCR5601871.1 putative ABC transporter permease [Ruminococcus sp.]